MPVSVTAAFIGLLKPRPLSASRPIVWEYLNGGGATVTIMGGVPRRSQKSDNRELFKFTVDDLVGVDLHPALEDGGVRRAEVDVVLQVAESEVVPLERRVLTVHSTRDVLAQDERHAAGTMIGTG